jgi:hypothetical protein
MISIIYILSNPLSKRDYARYGIENMKDAGIKYLVIDAFGLFYKSKTREKIKGPKEKSILFVNSLNNLNEILSVHKPAKVIIIAPICLDFYKIVSNVNSLGMEVGTIKVGALPSSANSVKGYSSRISSLIKRKGILSVFIKIYESAVIRFNFKKTYLDYIFYGGVKSIDKSHRIFSTARSKVSVHTLDYDSFLRRGGRLIQERYIVFIDQYLPHHPDILLLSSGGVNCASNGDIEEYYYYLNKFFKKIEKKYKCKVVISAHPRSDYVNKDPIFFKREVVFDNTKELIQYSEFCITYNSTAVNFAVLYQKPIMFINMGLFDNFVNKHDQDVAYSMSYELDSMPCKIDRNHVILTDLKVNKNKYREYQINYIKEVGSEQGFFWDIVRYNMLFQGEG